MRRLYRLILRAHPKRFRERFSTEMLCIYDDALQTQGPIRLILDGVGSLLRQRLFGVCRERNSTPRTADGSSVFSSYSAANQLGTLKVWPTILGAAFSFALLVVSCALIGGGRLNSAKRSSVSAFETDAAHALVPSDLMSVSDECIPSTSVRDSCGSSKSAAQSADAMSGSLSRPNELPFPSGRFGIGQVSYPLSPSDMPASGETNAELKLLIWYPASVDADTSVPVDNVWGYSKSMEKFVQTHTVQNAAVAHESERFPLILFSPASGNKSAAYLSQIENLVSHGYIVASLQDEGELNAVGFRETRLTEFERDMRRASFQPATGKPESSLARAQRFELSREKAESARLHFVFSQIILISTDRSRHAPFAGHIDLERVAAFGHGSGGNAIARLCASDPRIAACVDEDGWTANGLLAESNPAQLPRQPFLWIDVPLKQPDPAELAYAHISRDNFARLAKASAAGADLELRSFIAGAYHVSLLSADLSDKNFTDAPIIWSMKQGEIGDTDARNALAVTNLYSRVFFDKYLKQKSAPLLELVSDSPFAKVHIQRYGAR
jgi:hypothetical protein